jgi:2-aminoethylphosphonate-pyruvate transaminase
LGALCKRIGRPLLLDGVSSFGGEDIRFTEWNLEAVAGTANKCLHGVPGVSFVLVKRAVLSSRPSGATTVYLDLWRHWKEQQTGFSPFTQSVQVVYALQEALTEMEEMGGVRTRHSEYVRRSGVVRAALAELGVERFVAGSEELYSSILTSFKMPSHVTYEHLHDELRARGFVIYAGQGPYAGHMFRIAVMGDLTQGDLDELVFGLRAVLARPVTSRLSGST